MENNEEYPPTRIKTLNSEKRVTPNGIENQIQITKTSQTRTTQNKC